MVHTVIIILILAGNSMSLPTPQEHPGMDNPSKQEIQIDTLTHKIHTSNELLTPSNHGVRGATPISDIFCFLTVPITDIVSLIAGLAPQPCKVLYNSRTLK